MWTIARPVRMRMSWPRSGTRTRSDGVGDQTSPVRGSVLRASIGRCHSRCMSRRDRERMSEAEVHALFDRLFPRGFAGQDVLDEIAPEGWEQSPLLACFHPSVERIFEERLLMHRNLKELGFLRRRRDSSATDVSSPEPTFEDVRKEYEPSPVEQDAEVTELV